MKYVSLCIEFETSKSVNILDTLFENEIKDKESVLAYLKSGFDHGILCSAVYDYVLNRSTGDTVHCYCDEEYEWDDREIYHFEHYNMKLNEKFLNHVRNKKYELK